MTRSLLFFATLVLLNDGASAQSRLEVYGRVDLAVVRDSGSPTGKSWRLSSGVSGGSRIGFRGSEDLGAGMIAGFQLETGYCADSAAGAPNFCTGGNQFMGRQAHADLSGTFGAISAGRQYSVGFINLVRVDPFGEGFAPDINNLVDGAGTRLNNSLRYATPSMSGFSATGEIGLGEQTGNWKAGRVTAASLNYSSRPAYVGAVFYQLEDASGRGVARKIYQLGATYDFDIVKLHGLAQRTTGATTAGASVDAFDLMVGIAVPTGAGSFRCSYVRHADRSALRSDADQLGAGFLYPLSTRTSAYTSLARINNLHGAVFTVGNATERGTGTRSFDVGLVHNF